MKEVKLPEKIENIDGFQLKAINQKILYIVNNHNVGFEFDSAYLSFIIYELNVDLNINYDSIVDLSYVYDSEAFNNIVKYIDYVNDLLIEGIDLSYICNLSDLHYDPCDIDDFDFLSWNLSNLKSTPSPINEKV